MDKSSLKINKQNISFSNIFYQLKEKKQYYMLHMHVQLNTFQTKYFFFILRLPYNIKTLFHERYPPYFELNVMLSIVKKKYVNYDL